MSQVVLDSYSAAAAQLPLVELDPEARQILLDGGNRPQPSMVSLDPPVHTRLRRPTARARDPHRGSRAVHCPAKLSENGKGIHFCIGSALGKLEALLALEALTNRVPKMRLVPDQTFTFHPNISFRGPQALRVEVR
jgi:cytochrome P450